MRSQARAALFSLLVLASQCVGAEEAAADSEWLILSAPAMDHVPAITSSDGLSPPPNPPSDYLLLLLALALVGLAPRLGSEWGIRTFGRRTQMQSIPAPPAWVEATATTPKPIQAAKQNAAVGGGRQISSAEVAVIGRSDLQQRLSALRETLPAGVRGRLLIAEAHLEHGQMRTATQMIEQLERESKISK